MFTPTPDINAELMDDMEFLASCGHIEAIPAHVDPDHAPAWVRDNSFTRVCRDCWLDQQNCALDEFDQELPKLRGSDKQITWARSIRREMVTDIAQRIALAEDLGKKRTVIKKLLKTLQGIQGVTDASLWIDARSLSAEAFYDDLLRMMRATHFRRIKATT